MKDRFCYKVLQNIILNYNLGFCKKSYQKCIEFYRLDLKTNFEGNVCKKRLASTSKAI